MRYFQVHSKYPGSEEEVSSDHVVAADSGKDAREYVEHRWSPAYGYDPAKAPQLVRLQQISRHKAEDLIESGAIDWT